MISTALRTGTPLPQITPCPLLDRFILYHHGLNVIRNEDDDDYGLPRTMSSKMSNTCQLGSVHTFLAKADMFLRWGINIVWYCDALRPFSACDEGARWRAIPHSWDRVCIKGGLCGDGFEHGLGAADT